MSCDRDIHPGRRAMHHPVQLPQVCSVALSTVYCAGTSARGSVAKLIAWVTAVHSTYRPAHTETHTPNYSSNPPGLYLYRHDHVHNKDCIHEM